MEGKATNCALCPVMDPKGLSFGLPQVYLVLDGTMPFVILTGAILNELPLQIVCGGIEVMFG
jgi:hypothetical protein